MTDQERRRELGDALAAALDDQAGAERYRRYQREARNGTRVRAAGGARPQEFDGRGFPVPQRSASFVERVARLLNSL
jgi:hypothetical protein